MDLNQLFPWRNAALFNGTRSLTYFSAIWAIFPIIPHTPIHPHAQTVLASRTPTLPHALAGSPVICIDPGHPSENGVGTHGKKVTELHAAWEVGVRLRRLLEQDGFTVVMTKTSEHEYVTNKRRADIANQAHAFLMVRIHCDAGQDSGFASYYPARQGRVHGVTGPTRTVIEESAVMARRFHPAVIAALHFDLADRGLKTDSETMIGHRQGGALTGSIYSKVPTILVEMAVLQNSHDDSFIASAKGQEEVAKALEAGVRAATKL